MSNDPIRRERTGVVAGDLSESARGDLAQCVGGPGYQRLLDIMEMACIKIESALVNTPPDNEKLLAARHKEARAAWQFFEWVQRKVQFEIAEHLSGARLTQPPVLPFGLDGDEPAPFPES